MARDRKESKNLNFRLAKSVSDPLDRFCEETGMTKTTAVEKILSSYFEDYFNRPETERKLFK